MHKKRLSIFLIILLLMLSIVYDKSAYAGEIRQAFKATYVSDCGDGNYGIDGVGGTKVRGASYGYLGGYYGWYYATMRAVDLGRVYYMDGSNNLYFDFGLNNVLWQFEYSSDGVNWNYYGSTYSSGSGPGSEWCYASTSASWWQGKSVRYFRLLNLGPKDSSRPSAIDDLVVELKMNEANPPNINIGQRFSWWSNQDQVLTADVSDTQSGIQSFNLPTQWGAWNVWGDTYNKSANKTLTGEGWYGSPSVSATDNCGNTISKTYTAFGIDKSPPYTNYFYVSNSPYRVGNDYWVKPGSYLKVDTEIDDSVSGVSSTYLRNLSYDGSVDNRCVYDWNSSLTNEFQTTSQVSIGNVSGSSFSQYQRNNTWFIYPKNYDLDYHVQTYAYDYASNGFPGYTTQFNMRVDGTKPISDNLTITMIDINNYKIDLKNCRDTRSGLDDSTVRVAIWHDGESYRDWYTLTRVSGTNDFTVTVNLDSWDHFGKYGKFNAHVYASDHVGNDGYINGTQFTRVDPKPTNGNLIVKDYDYKEGSNIYWMKVGNQFRIYNEGYLPTIYGIYPTRNYVLFQKDGSGDIGNSGRFWSDKNGNYSYGSEFYTYLDNTGGYTSIESKSGGMNYLAADHIGKGLIDNTNFLLWHCTTFFTGGTEYYNGYTNSDTWIKFDGAPPTGTINVNMNFSSGVMTISANKVLDSGSGVKRVYANYYDPLNPSAKQTVDLVQSGKTWSLDVKPMDYFKSDDVKIDVYTVDNVGNVGKIGSNTEALFTVDATVAPYNHQDAINNPALMKGQRGVLKIVTTGYVERVDIAFDAPLDLLNKSITLTPKPIDGATYEFDIPLENVDEKQYTITVEGYKSTRYKTATPTFSTNGSVLDRLKTRVLN